MTMHLLLRHLSARDQPGIFKFGNLANARLVAITTGTQSSYICMSQLNMSFTTLIGMHSQPMAHTTCS